jgi:hypothetical protein
MTKHIGCVICALPLFLVSALLGSVNAIAETIPGRWELVEMLAVDSPITVRTSAGESVQALFLKLEPEFLILHEQSNSEIRILRTQVIEVARPKPKKFWTGTKIGAITGFVAGFVIGYAAGDDGIFYDMTAGFNGIVLGGAGAGAGALAGAIVKKARERSEVIYKAAPNKMNMNHQPPG